MQSMQAILVYSQAKGGGVDIAGQVGVLHLTSQTPGCG